jgi:hypothetical protein
LKVESLEKKVVLRGDLVWLKAGSDPSTARPDAPKSGARKKSGRYAQGDNFFAAKSQEHSPFEAQGKQE